jgi:hypothetical protein
MAAIFVGGNQFCPSGGDTKRSTTAETELGSKQEDNIGNEYRYIKAGAAIAQYDAVRLSGSALGFDDVRPTSAINQVVIGAATAAFASGDYGYILTKGVATVKTVVSTAAGSQLVSNGTAGTLAIAVAANDLAVRPAVALVTGVAAGSAVALL